MKSVQTVYPPAVSAGGGVRVCAQNSLGNHFGFQKFEYVRFLHFCRRSLLTLSMQLRARIPFVAALSRCLTEVTLCLFGY
jgi:hypothetical protein